MPLVLILIHHSTGQDNCRQTGQDNCRLILLVVVTVAAILGGYPGNWIMYFKLSSAQVKKFIVIILYLLAGKFIFDLML